MSSQALEQRGGNPLVEVETSPVYDGRIVCVLMMPVETYSLASRFVCWISCGCLFFFFFDEQKIGVYYHRIFILCIDM